MRCIGLFSLTLALVVSTTLDPSGLVAQPTIVVPRTEFGLDATHWRLDEGTVSARATTLWGAAMRLGIRPSTHHPRTILEAAAFYAPADHRDLDPRVSGFQLGLAFSVVPPSRQMPANLSFSLGYAALHFDARALEEAIAECASVNGCLFEGILYRTGWRSAMLGGAALQISVAPAFSIRFGVDLLAPLGSGGGSSSGNHLRYGVGAAWRR
jgi:hypothetical protein